MKKYLLLVVIFLTGSFWSCQKPGKTSATENSNASATENSKKLRDDELLTLVQRNTFQYFWDGAEPTSGLARERIHLDGDYPLTVQYVITTSVLGFGVMAIFVGIERKFIARQEGFKRFLKKVDYLVTANLF